MTRPRAALALLTTVVTGLALQGFRDRAGSDAAGSVLYAMAACFAIALIWWGRPRAVGAAAFVACLLVELAQLTGIPARLPALRLVLGSGFNPLDILWYAVGALVGVAVMTRAGGAAPSTRR